MVRLMNVHKSPFDHKELLLWKTHLFYQWQSISNNTVFKIITIKHITWTESKSKNTSMKESKRNY